MNRTERLQKRIEQEQAWRKEIKELRASLIKSESGAAGLLSGRKVFVCKGCSGIYADEPVTACDCTVGKDQPGFEEGVIVMNSTPAGKSMVAWEVLEQAQEALHDLNEFADTLNGITVSGDIVAKCIWDRVKKGLSANQELERSGG